MNWVLLAVVGYVGLQVLIGVAVASRMPSALTATWRTVPPGRTVQMLSAEPESGSQTRTLPSQPPVTMSWPVELKAMAPSMLP